MSLLITSISASQAELMIARARQALAAGSDLVELRLDSLDSIDQALPRLIADLPPRSWIATCRHKDEGGRADLGPPALLSHLRNAVAGGAAGVDIEFQRLKSLGALAALSQVLPGADQNDVVVSSHYFESKPADLTGRVAEQAAGGAIAKIAWRCEDVNDNFTAFEIMRSESGRRIAICMGEKGVLSRLLAPKFNAYGSFCALSTEDATAPGQLTLGDMLERYRWKRLGPDTRLYGVIGSPIAHSLSPTIFNEQFATIDVPGVYLPLRIDTRDEFNRFLDGCRERPWLDARGFSVTVPHKQAALRWATDRGAAIEPLAQRIGAVNTLVFDGERARAFNTDYAGAMAALEAAMGADARDLARLPVAVLGAGGVARAVVAGLADRGCRVTIHNRSPEAARLLASDFDCVARPWEERVSPEQRVVINCTSVGMSPCDTLSPLPRHALRPNVTVFDTIYTPRNTRLLEDARMAGCKTVGGAGMFIHQAAAQFRLWTEREPDLAAMERAVTRAPVGANRPETETAE
jgi:3-dehydroquinate dehydratase/shikimate dehydrogenase